MPICQADILCLAGSVFPLLPGHCLLLRGAGVKRRMEPRRTQARLPPRLSTALAMAEVALMWRPRGGGSSVGTSVNTGKRKSGALAADSALPLRQRDTASLRTYPLEAISGQRYTLDYPSASLLESILCRPGVLKKQLQCGLATTVEKGECVTPPIARALHPRCLVPGAQFQTTIGIPLQHDARTLGHRSPCSTLRNSYGTHRLVYLAERSDSSTIDA